MLDNPVNIYEPFLAIQQKLPPNQNVDSLKEALDFKDFMENMPRILFGGFDPSLPYQQHLCYAWEQTFIEMSALGNHGNMPEASTQKIVDDVRSSYGQKPDVKSVFRVDIEGSQTRVLNKEYRGIGPVKDQIIETQPKYACAWVIYHEAAHSVLNSIGKFELQNHGPMFVRLLCDIATKLGGLDLAKLIQSAKDAGLKVSDDLPVDIRQYGVKP